MKSMPTNQLLSVNDFNYLSILNKKKYLKYITDGDQKQYLKYIDSKDKTADKLLAQHYAYFIASDVPDGLEPKINYLEDLIDHSFSQQSDVNDNDRRQYLADLTEVQDVINNYRLLHSIKNKIITIKEVS